MVVPECLEEEERLQVVFGLLVSPRLGWSFGVSMVLGAP